MNIFQRLLNWFTSLYNPPVPQLPPVKPAPPIVPTPMPPTAVIPPAPVMPPAKAQFDVSIAYVLKNEGGYVNNPNDKGGCTNFGITQATYSAYKSKAVSCADVKTMPLSDAKAIYQANYWTANLSLLDQGVATAILDWSVLHGTHNGRSLAQQACIALGVHCVVDGVIGPATVAAVNSLEPKKFIAEYQREVKAYFQALVARNPSQAVFLAGWMNRANEMSALV